MNKNCIPKKNHPWKKGVKARKAGSESSKWTKAGKEYLAASKRRRVFVTLELETPLPLAKLREPHLWTIGWTKCLQAQVNVARGSK